MYIGIVDTRNLGIRYNNEGKITEGLDAMSKTNRYEGQAEIGGREKRVGGQRRATVPGMQESAIRAPSLE